MLWQTRSEMLLGTEGIERLQNACVAVIGAGGVGGGAIEALARAGVGHLRILDPDTFALHNLNRQLLATLETVGRGKAAVAVERVHAINPRCDAVGLPLRLLPDNREALFALCPDIILDACDTTTTKIDLIVECGRRGVPLLSCMGTGNRLSPDKLRIGDLSETAGTGCGLARILRRELRRRGIEHQRVVYSTEMPLPTGSRTPGSVAFVPPAAGMLMAAEAVRWLLGA